MEKKMTRRIVGVLVIAALVIILLPLLFTGGEQQTSTQTVEMKTPPAVTEAQNSTNPAPPSLASLATAASTPAAPVQTTAAAATNAPLALPVPTKKPDSLSSLTPAQPTSSNSNQVVTVVPPTSEAKADQAVTAQEPPASVSTPAKEPSTPETAKTETIKLLNEDKTSQHTEVFQPSAQNDNSTYRSKIKANPVIDDMEKPAKPTAMSVKKSGWVVQLGSFKNKNNAKRLTALLKTKGYHVFTYESKATGQTRVCVGPETLRMRAVSLSKKIEREVRVHGFVVSYE